MRPRRTLVLLVAAAAAWSPATSVASAAPSPRDATVVSSNWAGYAASGAAGSFSSVSAQWTQPSVTCGGNETSFSAFWVGLDGYTSGTVEQIGAASECVNGSPRYYAWYEVYPKLAARCSISIDAGDAIDASVAYRSGEFHLSLTDGSDTCEVSAKASHRFERSSAEVIAEAPSSNHGPHGTLDLADFGTVRFTGATVNGSALADADPDRVVMRSGDTVKARPSRLKGSRFSVVWLSA